MIKTNKNLKHLLGSLVLEKFKRKCEGKKIKRKVKGKKIIMENKKNQ